MKDIPTTKPYRISVYTPIITNIPLYIVLNITVHFKEHLTQARTRLDPYTVL